MQVDFKFNVDDEVVVKAVSNKIVTGVVTMCAFERGGITYYVQMGESGSWWHEDQLEKML